MGKRPNSREAILDAAEMLAAEVGANHMSLDAVAAKAGISKGGLLYQFPSKVALLQGMLVRYVERLEAPQKPKSKNASEAGRLLAARLAARGNKAVAKERRNSFGMIAAIAEQPALLDPVREAHQRIWSKFRKTSSDPEMALLAWLALEGLLFVELFGTSPLSKGERDKFLKRLTAIADQSSA